MTATLVDAPTAAIDKTAAVSTRKRIVPTVILLIGALYCLVPVLWDHQRVGA